MSTSRKSGGSLKRRGPALHVSRSSLVLLGTLAAFKAVGLIFIAEAIARSLAALAAGHDVEAWYLWLGLGGAVLRALAHWVSQNVARRVALGEKEALRGRLLRRAVLGGGRDVDGGLGSVAVLANRGLDELDNYYVQYVPAIVSCAVIPLVVGARILAADWVSALIIVLTIPLVPLFMALIGFHTNDAVADSAATLRRLSDHLVELARGLPVLVGLGRSAAQTRALRDISVDYRERTLKVLRTAFMSSLALELIATISVAVVAVFIGIRLVHGQMDLQLGLLVLILAPDCYLPLRELGAAYHASEDGLRARTDAEAMLNRPALRRMPAAGGSGRVQVEGLTVAYAGRSRPAVDGVSLRLKPGSLTALTGPSGCGKSTVLSVLAGVVGDVDGVVRVSGEVSGFDPERVAYLPQHPVTTEATVAAEVESYAGTAASSDTAGLLDRVGLADQAHAHPGQLSPGQLRRLGLARVLARVDGGAELVLLDEPTAHLDARSAAILGRVITELRGRVTVLMVAHDPRTVALADDVVVMGGTGAPLVEAQAEGSAGPPSEIEPNDAEPPAELGARTAPSVVERVRLRWRVLKLALDPGGRRFVGAALAGTFSALFAIALTALSGWLILRASTQPPILFLLSAIVGVRFFGIGRSVLRYCERLWLHSAIFAALTDLRIALWRSLSARAGSLRVLARGEVGVGRLIGDVDQLRDLAPRVVLPPLVAVTVAVGASIATGLLVPQLLGLQAVILFVLLIVAPLLGVLADRRAAAAEQSLRAEVLTRSSTTLFAGADLVGNGVADAALDRLAADDRRATRAAQRAVNAQGLAGAVVIATCGIGSLAMVLAGAPLVLSGQLSPEVLAVVVLMQLALADTYLAAVAALQQAPALISVLDRFVDLVRPAPASPRALLESSDRLESSYGQGDNTEPLSSAELDGVVLSWPVTEPASDGFAVGPVSARPMPSSCGGWTVVTGPSGSGKSTLLAGLLGFLPPSDGEYLLDEASVLDEAGGERLRRLSWCPQQAHLFDSSLRANIALGREREHAPTDAELDAVVDAVGLRPLVGELEDGLDTRVGPSGSSLSGGQRMRVAVARTLLHSGELVLLDEPTAHLDTESAEALMADLREALTDRSVVLVTHDRSQIQPGDTVLDLADVDRPGAGGTDSTGPAANGPIGAATTAASHAEHAVVRT